MSQRPKRILLLDSARGSGVTFQVVFCLAATRRFVIDVLTPHRDSPLRASRFVHRAGHLPLPNDPDHLVQQIHQCARSFESDLILPVNLDQIDLFTTSAVEPLLRDFAIPPQPSPEAFRIACSKTELSAFMEEHGVPHPATVRVPSGDPDSIQRALAMAMPVIAKPTWGGGGSGMKICRTPDDLRAFLVKSMQPGNPYIVQEFITGTDLGCAAFCRNGEVIAMTMQRNLAVNSQSVQPSKGLDFFDDPSVRQIVTHLLGALGWTGIAQIDLRQNAADGSLAVLEINPRYWGSTYGSQRMGINFPEMAVDLGLGRTPKDPDYRPGRYITGWGYLLHWRDRLMCRETPHFRLAESTLPELVSDPLRLFADFRRRLAQMYLRKH